MNRCPFCLQTEQDGARFDNRIALDPSQPFPCIACMQKPLNKWAFVKLAYRQSDYDPPEKEFSHETEARH